MKYEIASQSLKGRKKESFEKNGDCCQWMETNSCVVLALADGVGSCADDARASQTACALFMQQCKEAINQDIRLKKDDIVKFCEAIDPELAKVDDMVCFCAVVWYFDEKEVVFLHVGDTRIYKYNLAQGIEQMTQDDHGKAVNVKIGGKLYTDHGCVVSAVPISKAIGDESLDYHSGSFSFHEGESLVLCSDGMYSSSTFRQDVQTLLQKANLNETVGGLSTTDDDDASILVLRRNVSSEGLLDVDEVMANYEWYLAQYPFNTLIEVFSNSIQALLQSREDTGRLEKTVLFAKDNKLYPDKQQIDRLFNLSIAAYNGMPEGEEKQRYYGICIHLKDILQKVFRSK